MGGIFKQCLRVIKPGSHALVWALPRTSHWTALALEYGGWTIRDCIYHVFPTGFPKSVAISKEIDRVLGEKPVVTRIDYRSNSPRGLVAVEGENQRMERKVVRPLSKAAQKWGGWGTGLKPSVECWWLAQRPFRGAVARNVLEHGTGGLNLGVEGWPEHGIWTGGKPPLKERNLGVEADSRENIHPTVKSLELMRWLCRLITPPEGTVLDPFMGSGTTGMGALLEGFSFIGIERELRYFEIAERRLQWALKEAEC